VEGLKALDLKSPNREEPQRFLSVHDQVGNLFRRPANTNAADHRKARARAFTTWAEVAGFAAAF
jgi:putative transposase